MALGTQIVNFIWVQVVEELHHLHRIGEIPVVEKELYAVYMWVLIEVVNTICVESGSSSNDAMHFIAFSEKKLR